MSSEASRVRMAVVESQAIGTLSTTLCRLVEKITRKRCCPQMADDISQHVLLGLLRHLSTIIVATSYEYISSAICKTWQNMMRGRRYERKYLLWAIGEAVREQIPTHERPRMYGEAYGSYLTKLKYY